MNLIFNTTPTIPYNVILSEAKNLLVAYVKPRFFVALLLRMIPEYH